MYAKHYIALITTSFLFSWSVLIDQQNLFPLRSNATTKTNFAMTKHLTNNSVLKRASLFENRNLEQSTSSNSQRDVSSIVASAALAAASNNNNSKEVDLFQDSIKGNLNTFKKEYLQLYPNNKLPFLELHSLEETKQLNTTLQNRIKELRNELSRTEFVTTFLDEILARNEDNSGIDIDL